jgi:hypothetical protein
LVVTAYMSSYNDSLLLLTFLLSFSSARHNIPVTNKIENMWIILLVLSRLCNFYPHFQFSNGDFVLGF